MLLDKTKLSLVRNKNSFIYVDLTDDQFYEVMEPQNIIPENKYLVVAYIAGGSLIKQLDHFYLPISHFQFNLILLLLFLFLITLYSRKQLKALDKELPAIPLTLSLAQKKEIIEEAKQNVRINQYIFLTLIVLWTLSVFLFLFFSVTLFLISSLVFWYVLNLLRPTLKLKERKHYLALR
ncbi:hypothetical protein [Streptococcus sp. CSL10205-OR2]|uniref:hypothetical protein n=1 Tax=Streptococcus sp. CSL10205-OR2 TaxID=2980558 RepID=UPI0021D82D19|nr:hypothetical protein [Streptococcus sp. CSL10205-OR2]MCU9534158.1 hypothetical protein [Streptococcus sp. CSL10205-OR2]